MNLNPVKIIDATVAAARLNAALKRLNVFRHIASELRHTPDEYDRKADEGMRAMKEQGDGRAA